MVMLIGLCCIALEFAWFGLDGYIPLYKSRLLYILLSFIFEHFPD